MATFAIPDPWEEGLDSTCPTPETIPDDDRAGGELADVTTSPRYHHSIIPDSNAPPSDELSDIDEPQEPKSMAASYMPGGKRASRGPRVSNAPSRRASDPTMNALSSQEATSSVSTESSSTPIAATKRQQTSGAAAGSVVAPTGIASAFSGIAEQHFSFPRDATESQSRAAMRELIQSVKDKRLASNAMDRDTKSTLILCCAKFGLTEELTEVLKLCRSHKQTIDTPNKEGVTPLLAAVQGKHEAAMCVLLQHGADVSLLLPVFEKPSKQLTILAIAVQQRSLPLITALLTHNRPLLELRSHHKYTPLHIAAEVGDAVVLQTLLTYGADVTALDDTKGTPLHTAAYNGHCECMQGLLQKHSALNAVDQYGLTPLHLATTQDHTEAVKLLLSQRGIRPNEVTRNGETALHLAALNGNAVICEMLCKSMSMEGIKAKNVVGKTFLHHAVHEDASHAIDGSPRHVVQALPRPVLTSVVNIADDKGVTVLHIITKCLQARVTKRSAWAPTFELLKTLIESGADKYAESSSKVTPMSLAEACLVDGTLTPEQKSQLIQLFEIGDTKKASSTTATTASAVSTTTTAGGGRPKRGSVQETRRAPDRSTSGNSTTSGAISTGTGLTYGAVTTSGTGAGASAVDAVGAADSAITDGVVSGGKRRRRPA